MNHLLMLLVLLLVAVFAVACSQNDNQSSESSATPTATETPKATAAPTATPTPIVNEKPVTLYLKERWAGYDGNPEMFQQEYAIPVKTKFPHITLELTPGVIDNNAVVAKEPMDILQTSVAFVSNLTDLGLNTDLEPLVKKHGYDLTRLNPEAVDAAKTMTDGALSYIPIYVSHSAPILYNKDIFDRFGISYPKDGMTWDEIYEIAKQLTRKDNDQQYLGFTISVDHYVRRNQLSLNVVDPQTLKVSLNNDGAKALIENVLRFYTLEGYDRINNKTGAAQSRDAFLKDQNVAMWSTINGYKPEESLSTMNWDAVSYPTWPGKPGIGPMVYPVYAGVSSTSQHPDEAFQVISYLTSEEFQLEKVKHGIYVSTLLDENINKLYGTEVPLLKGKNAQAFTYGRPAAAAPQSKYYTQVAARILLAALDTLTEGTDINTALREREEEAKLLVQEMSK